MENKEGSEQLLQEEIEKKAMKIAKQLEGLSYYDVQCILKEVEKAVATLATIKF